MTNLHLAKKWGILIKREFESLNFTGLEIPRDYYTYGEDWVWIRGYWIVYNMFVSK